MKKISLKIQILTLLFVGISAYSQQKISKDKVASPTVAEKKKALELEKSKLIKPYHPEEDANAKMNELLERAKAEDKNIIIQAGGNWCIWCLRFNQFVQDNPELKDIADGKLLYYHLNWSPENKNEPLFEKYGNPGEKYGYPVFIVLNKMGDVLQIQESSVFEEGKGYSKEKVRDFLIKWASAEH
jgi:thioredoxin-related protein